MAVYQGTIVSNSTNDAEGLVANVTYTAQTVTAPGVPYTVFTDEHPVGGRQWTPVDDPSGPYVMPARANDPCFILTGPGKVGIVVLTEYLSSATCGGGA